MLRNDLITLLAQHDNDTVTVSVNGRAVDVEGVVMDNGAIAIVLNSDGLQAAQMVGKDFATPLNDRRDVLAAISSADPSPTQTAGDVATNDIGGGHH